MLAGPAAPRGGSCGNIGWHGTPASAGGEEVESGLAGSSHPAASRDTPSGSAPVRLPGSTPANAQHSLPPSPSPLTRAGSGMAGLGRGGAARPAQRASVPNIPVPASPRAGPGHGAFQVPASPRAGPSHGLLVPASPRAGLSLSLPVPASPRTPQASHAFNHHPGSSHSPWQSPLPLTPHNSMHPGQLTPRGSVALHSQLSSQLSGQLAGKGLSLRELQALAQQACTSLSDAEDDAKGGHRTPRASTTGSGTLPPHSTPPDTPTSRLSCAAACASPFAGAVFDRPSPFGHGTRSLATGPTQLSEEALLRQLAQAGGGGEAGDGSAEEREAWGMGGWGQAGSSPPNTPTSRMSVVNTATSPFANAVFDRPCPFTTSQHGPVRLQQSLSGNLASHLPTPHPSSSSSHLVTQPPSSSSPGLVPPSASLLRHQSLQHSHQKFSRSTHL
ncbi:hypothetical protein V8C86DRAFT_2750889, partial [Haematococcus lacustris]